MGKYLKFEYNINTDIDFNFSIIITVNFFTSVQQVITGKMRRVCMYGRYLLNGCLM
jgi:hypothetical protein